MKLWRKWVSVLAALLIVFSIGKTVIADDDDIHDQKQEYHQNDHDDDEGEYENDEDNGDWIRGNQQSQVLLSQQADYWHIWSREPRNNPDNPLPINVPSELKVITGSQEKSVYFIPQEGQLFVSAQTIADLLGAEQTFYPQSKISVLSKSDRELIVRAGSNAVYENRIKTPMPVQAAFYENSIFLPISVAANSLGYRVTWDSAKQALILQSI